MKNVFFQWWQGPAGQQFTTLHLSQNAASRFRREVSARVRSGKWKSALHSKIGRMEVANSTHQNIAIRLHGRYGVRAFISDFTKYKML